MIMEENINVKLYIRGKYVAAFIMKNINILHVIVCNVNICVYIYLKSKLAFFVLKNGTHNVDDLLVFFPN